MSFGYVEHSLLSFDLRRIKIWSLYQEDMRLREAFKADGQVNKIIPAA